MTLFDPTHATYQKVAHASQADPKEDQVIYFGLVINDCCKL